MRALFALPLLLMIAGCSASADLRRVALPPATSIVPPPVALPEIVAGEDLGLRAEKHRAAAAENGRRLDAARRNYEALRRSYGGV